MTHVDDLIRIAAERVADDYPPLSEREPTERGRHLFALQQVVRYGRLEDRPAVSWRLLGLVIMAVTGLAVGLSLGWFLWAA